MTVTKRRPSAPLVLRRLADNGAELELYGCIVESRPKNFWGEPEEGQYIVLGDFLEELKAVEQVAELTVRIHSAGGDAYAAMVIHNRLKSLAARVTVVVDGVAMSGGSLIMCAGDRVQVYPGSLIMIHDCWAYLYGGYGSGELAQIIERNKSVDRAQIEIYKGKTGLSAETLQEMMSRETYMTGREAVAQGFADEVLEGEPGVQIAASADRNTLFVAGVPVWQARGQGALPPGLDLPVQEGAAVKDITKNRGGKRKMANNVEELRQEYPELTRELEAAARASVQVSEAEKIMAQEAERQRIKEIDAIAPLFDDELVQAAKYGEAACTAQELAFRAARQAAEQGKAFMGAIQQDNQASGAQEVKPLGVDPVGQESKENLPPEARMAEARASVKTLLGKAKE